MQCLPFPHASWLPKLAARYSLLLLPREASPSLLGTSAGLCSSSPKRRHCMHFLLLLLLLVHLLLQCCRSLFVDLREVSANYNRTLPTHRFRVVILYTGTDVCNRHSWDLARVWYAVVPLTLDTPSRERSVKLPINSVNTVRMPSPARGLLSGGGCIITLHCSYARRPRSPRAARMLRFFRLGQPVRAAYATACPRPGAIPRADARLPAAHLFGRASA